MRNMATRALFFRPPSGLRQSRRRQTSRDSARRWRPPLAIRERVDLVLREVAPAVAARAAAHGPWGRAGCQERRRSSPTPHGSQSAGPSGGGPRCRSRHLERTEYVPFEPNLHGHLERTEYVPFEPNLHGSGMSFPEALNLVIEALDEWPGLFVEDRTKGRGENAGPLIT